MIASDTDKIGILAGKGVLPYELIAACREKGTPFCLVAFEGETDRALTEGVEHFWTRLGAVGDTLDRLREKNVATLVMAGRIERPRLSSLRPDAKAARWLARLGTSLFAGDDRLLRTLCALLEEENFRLIGADTLLPSARVESGVIAGPQPQPNELDDLRQGFAVAKSLGRHDIGQGVIVCAGHVLGVEAIEGTDALIERCSRLRPEGTAGGVLVKVSKPQQDRRADLPAIGPRTIENLHAAGFSGVGLEVGESLIIERQKTLELAGRRGIFIYGMAAEAL